MSYGIRDQIQDARYVYEAYQHPGISRWHPFKRAVRVFWIISRNRLKHWLRRTVAR